LSFPIEITSNITLSSGNVAKTVTLHSGMTVILGPNGSGKTQLMRGMKQSLQQAISGKKVSFVSAGRIGILESYRSDYDGQRSGQPRYDEAVYGGKREQARRHQTETLNGAFQTLAARPDILIKVKERLRKLFKRDIEIRWDAGAIKVFFLHGDSAAYSSGREASGLLHLVGLLAMIYDDDVGALLLDEPEVSLHPQLQAFLLQEIISVSGWPEAETNKKIIVLCTHSTEFIELSKPSDLLNLVFVSEISENPTQIPADAGELQSRKIAALLGRMGQEHKLALFASSPLLVEGPSDVIVGSSVARKLDLQLEAGGSQVLPVIGKGQFAIVCKLFRMMGKRPVILADADALTDNLELAHFILNSQSANIAAASLGAGSATELASQVYNDFCQMTDANWASIEAEAAKHPYWIEREHGQGDAQRKAQRRSAFSTIFILSDEEVRSLDHGEQWESIKRRLETLLSLLEAEGCFVLRKGAIESYFAFNAEEGAASKPEVAAVEAAGLAAADSEQVRRIYEDVVRCLQFASAAEKIVEAEALQEVLLAICAPALAKIRAGQGATNLNAIARSVTPELAGMFDLQAVDGKLQISLKSKVLDVKGFPITVAGGEDVLTVVATALAIE
jgi:energy-coupling factor transporter ATP-binding protein EcfA2